MIPNYSIIPFLFQSKILFQNTPKWNVNYSIWRPWAGHCVIKSLVTQCVPLLRAGGDFEKVILSPLPRYVKSCCDNKAHLTNRRDPDFKTMMSEGLEEIQRSLNDLVAGKKIRNFKVMSPIQLLDNDEDTDEWIRSRKKFWAADPVHMTAEGYAELTRVLTMAASNANYDRAKEEGPAAAPAVNTAKSQRPPPRAFKRQEWVSADDTTAHRVYAKPQHLRGGKRGWSFQPCGFFRGHQYGRGRGGGVLCGNHRGRGGHRNRPY
jgi:hypothetical protein